MTYINLYEVESSHINGDPAEVTAGENQLIEIVNQITSVEPFLPYEYSLEQNYPNPFNPSTTIEFSLKHAGEIEIKIYNLLGQEVKTLFSGHLGSGFYSVKWDGRNNESTPLSSGAYIYKLTTDNFVQSKKMLLLK
ncbi:hypothetical protein ASZ90_004663 [hydrocarbon metagenome]|uniref:FlgD/Vpr Ig-like domain-containing protein n=1 Tax=hydrocarbon metagenome TaxID=938273 RepID=A0A0W8FXF1_9ZZZZ